MRKRRWPGSPGLGSLAMRHSDGRLAAARVGGSAEACLVPGAGRSLPGSPKITVGPEPGSERLRRTAAAAALAGGLCGGRCGAAPGSCAAEVPISAAAAAGAAGATAAGCTAGGGVDSEAGRSGGVPGDDGCGLTMLPPPPAPTAWQDAASGCAAPAAAAAGVSGVAAGRTRTASGSATGGRRLRQPCRLSMERWAPSEEMLRRLQPPSLSSPTLEPGPLLPAEPPPPPPRDALPELLREPRPRPGRCTECASSRRRSRPLLISSACRHSVTEACDLRRTGSQ